MSNTFRIHIATQSAEVREMRGASLDHVMKRVDSELAARVLDPDDPLEHYVVCSADRAPREEKELAR